MRKKSVLATILVVAIVFTLQNFNVLANNQNFPEIDPDERGSITIYRYIEEANCQDERCRQNVVGALVRLQKVTLIDVNRPTVVPDNVEIVEGFEPIFGMTNNDGVVVFEHLTQGIWMVEEVSHATIDGRLMQHPLQPSEFFADFLVSIPLFINDEAIFDVVARPKSELPPRPTPPPTPPPTTTAPPTTVPTTTRPIVGVDPSEPTQTTPPRLPNLPQTGMAVMGVTGISVAITGLVIGLIAKKRSDDDEEEEE